MTTPLRCEHHFPWYIDSADTDNIDCQCGQPCDGIAGWATHISNQLQGGPMDEMAQLTNVIYAIDRFKRAWTDHHLANNIATYLTCNELESLAGLLDILGMHDASETWITEHAKGDECDDQHCTCSECQTDRLTHHD